MKTYLQSFNLLTSEEIDAFEQLVQVKKVEKGDFFIQEGKVSNEIAFVAEGLYRSYYYNSEGEEVTYCFTFSNHFLSAYSSYLSQTPTVENIQALADSEIYTVSRSQIKELEKSSINWLKILKYITEQEYIKMEKRVFLLQKESAENRYKDLLNNQPELLQKIPLNYLSSYLGITQRHLSRIRKSLTF